MSVKAEREGFPEGTARGPPAPSHSSASGRPRGHRHGVKAQAMKQRRTPLRQGETMPNRPVAFVRFEGVLGSQPMIKPHEAIAGHLRHNGGAGDDATDRIPMDDGPAWHLDVWRGGAIDQDQLRLDREVADGASHRQQSGLQDVVLIDFLCAGQPDPDVGLTEDDLEGALPLAGRELFGIIDANGKACAAQHHRGGDHRSRPRPSPGLIHARDEAKPCGSRDGFRKPERALGKAAVSPGRVQ